MAAKLPSIGRSSINIFSMWGRRVSGLLVTLIIMPIIIRHYGLELVGIWLLISQFVQHLMLLDLGLNTSLTRFLARHRAKGDLEGAGDYLSATLFSLVLIGGIVIATAPFLAQMFRSWFEISPTVDNQVYWLVLIASLTVGLSLPLRTGIGMLSSAHRFDKLALWETLSAIARLLLVLICFNLFDPDFLLLGFISFIPMLLSNVMIFREGRKATSDIALSFKPPSKHVIMGVFSVSGAAIIITLSTVLVRQSSPMLVGFQLGPESVALLAFPILIVSAVMPFLNVANRLVSPIASQLAANEKKNELYEICISVGRYVFSISLLLLLFLYTIGFYMLNLWLGGANIEENLILEMATILVVIFAGVTVAIPGFVLRSILVAVGNHWQAATLEIIGSVIGLSIGIVLLMFTSLGIMGMAIGVSASFVVRGIGILSLPGAKYFDVPHLRLITICTFIPLLVFLIVCSSYGITQYALSTSSNELLVNLVSLAVATFTWALGNWLLVLDAEHRILIKQRVSRAARFIFRIRNQ